MVPLLQNHYHVPHVEVHEVNLNVGTRHFPPLAGLDWAPGRPGRSREGDPIYPGVGLFPTGGATPSHVDYDSVLPAISLPTLMHSTESGPVTIYIP